MRNYPKPLEKDLAGEGHLMWPEGLHDTKEDALHKMAMRKNMEQYPSWGDDPDDTLPLSAFGEDKLRCSVAATRFRTYFGHIVLRPGIGSPRRLFRELGLSELCTQREMEIAYKAALSMHPDAKRKIFDINKKQFDLFLSKDYREAFTLAIETYFSGAAEPRLEDFLSQNPSFILRPEQFELLKDPIFRVHFLQRMREAISIVNPEDKIMDIYEREPAYEIFKGKNTDLVAHEYGLRIQLFRLMLDPLYRERYIDCYRLFNKATIDWHRFERVLSEIEAADAPMGSFPIALRYPSLLEIYKTHRRALKSIESEAVPIAIPVLAQEAPETIPRPVSAPVPVPVPTPSLASAPAPVPTPKPASAPAPVPVPAPVPMPAPIPVSKPRSAPAPVPTPRFAPAPKPAAVVAPPPAPLPPLPKPIVPTVASKPLPVLPATVLPPAPVFTAPAPKPAPISELPIQNIPSAKDEPEEYEENTEASISIFQRLLERKWIVPALGAAVAGLVGIYASVQLYNLNSGSLNEDASNPVAPLAPEPLKVPVPEENKVKALPEKPVVAEQIDWSKEWEKERKVTFDKFFAFKAALEKKDPTFMEKTGGKCAIDKNEATKTGVEFTILVSSPKMEKQYTIEASAVLDPSAVEAFAIEHNIDKEAAAKYLDYKEINEKLQKILDVKKEEIFKDLKGGPDQIAKVSSSSVPKDSQIEVINGSTSETVAFPVPKPVDSMAAAQYTTRGWGPSTFESCPGSGFWDKNWTDQGAVAVLMVVCEEGKKVDACGLNAEGSPKPKVKSNNKESMVLKDPYSISTENPESVCESRGKGERSTYELLIRK